MPDLLQIFTIITTVIGVSMGASDASNSVECNDYPQEYCESPSGDAPSPPSPSTPCRSGSTPSEPPGDDPGDC